MIRTPWTILFFIVIASLCLSAGCISVRIADTHNTTAAVQSYNAWIAKEQVTDHTARGTIATIGNHVDTYNAEIAKDRPDITLLRTNLAEDQQLLNQWESGISNMTAATNEFEKNTSSMKYHNASARQVLDTLGLTTQYMRIYIIDSENARQHLIEYVSNAQAYITPDDPDYWNEKYRQDAMLAKEQAQASLTQGDAALGNITQLGVQLERLQ